MGLDEAFKLLKLDAADATLASARQAYKVQVKRYHPDRFANDERKRQKADDLLKRINAAYEQVYAYLKTVPPEKLCSVDASEGSQPAKGREAEVEDIFSFFLQKLRTLDIFAPFKNSGQVPENARKQQSSPQSAPTRFKDVLRDAQRRGYRGGMRKKTSSGKGGSGPKEGPRGQRKTPSRRYDGKKWLHKTGTGPVEAVKPVGRVRSIGRNR
jgi:hypothetical protein